MSKLKIIRCPECGKYMEEQELKGKESFWVCPYCEGEWWPSEKDDTPKKLAKAARKAFYEDVRVGYFGNGGKKGGGSRTKGRKKKIKPLPFSQRYKEV
ncbi:MAG: hypothetical protein PWQ67_2519 [Clostridia bacterium]|nr:hypothetical protein [Clostridia bacterium]